MKIIHTVGLLKMTDWWKKFKIYGTLLLFDIKTVISVIILVLNATF